MTLPGFCEDTDHRCTVSLRTGGMDTSKDGEEEKGTEKSIPNTVERAEGTTKGMGSAKKQGKTFHTVR